MTPHRRIPIVARLGTNGDPFCLDPRVCRREFADVAQDIERFLVPTFSSKPARREGKEVEDCHERDGEEDGEQEGEAPAPRRVDVASSIRLPSARRATRAGSILTTKYMMTIPRTMANCWHTRKAPRTFGGAISAMTDWSAAWLQITAPLRRFKGREPLSTRSDLHIGAVLDRRPVPIPAMNLPATSVA